MGLDIIPGLHRIVLINFFVNRMIKAGLLQHQNFLAELLKSYDSYGHPNKWISTTRVLLLHYWMNCQNCYPCAFKTKGARSVRNAFTKEINMQMYFCDPHTLWHLGTNETPTCKSGISFQNKLILVSLQRRTSRKINSF